MSATAFPQDFPKDPEETRHHGEAKPRQCLRCQTDFDSAWAGERICPRCKGTSAWRSGIPAATMSNSRR